MGIKFYSSKLFKHPLRIFSDQVQQMSREQAQEFLQMFYKQMMIREKTYQELLKHQWEVDSGSILG
ncbi:NblA/ycf18 family protein [Nostoc sp. FACHB-133]|uniref:NblA/ycf18 family protein n=1 Tax=Nostoc sp. FACHB-133 TaxID=2692835 RepID=UPI00168349A1|nr:NblA/ycf18 family protein [Nostoc sp. FACHB-133]MBD2527317.1 NblA/ycf18 family protein [Nostoc sp. FACHB-133]